jgi:hypothetical protein
MVIIARTCRFEVFQSSFIIMTGWKVVGSNLDESFIFLLATYGILGKYWFTVEKNEKKFLLIFIF